MSPKQYILRDGQEPGIYPGIGDVKVGKPFRVYSPEQEELVREDKRFKQYTAPAAPAEAPVTPDANLEGQTTKPASGAKDGKK